MNFKNVLPNASCIRWDGVGLSVANLSMERPWMITGSCRWRREQKRAFLYTELGSLELAVKQKRTETIWHAVICKKFEQKRVKLEQRRMLMQ